LPQLSVHAPLVPHAPVFCVHVFVTVQHAGLEYDGWALPQLSVHEPLVPHAPVF
jgi:hypothetical protein